jgi:hypothetical protein
MFIPTSEFEFLALKSPNNQNHKARLFDHDLQVRSASIRFHHAPERLPGS